MYTPSKKSDQDQDWFLNEVIPHENDVRNWLSVKFPTLHDVDDIIQEAYFKLMKAKTTGTLVNPRAYLFVTVKNLVISRWRHLRHENHGERKEIELLNIVDKMRSPSEAALLNDDVRIIVEALKALPVKCRQVMTLRKIYGLSQKEVAQKLGVSVNTVKTQSKIGLKKCGEYFLKSAYRREIR